MPLYSELLLVIKPTQENCGNRNRRRSYVGSRQVSVLATRDAACALFIASSCLHVRASQSRNEVALTRRH